MYKAPKEQTEDKREKPCGEPEPKAVIAKESRPEVNTDTLDEVSKKVLLAMPLDRGATPDELSIEGVDIGDVITALTMLEIEGFIESLPGGTYIRK